MQTMVGETPVNEKPTEVQIMVGEPAIAKKLPKDGEAGAGAGSGGTRLTQGGGNEGGKMGSCCNK